MFRGKRQYHLTVAKAGGIPAGERKDTRKRGLVQAETLESRHDRDGRDFRKRFRKAAAAKPAHRPRNFEPLGAWDVGDLELPPHLLEQ
jgi:hypothetical protein